jgi:hypothetical protein
MQANVMSLKGSGQKENHGIERDSRTELELRADVRNGDCFVCGRLTLGQL